VTDNDAYFFSRADAGRIARSVKRDERRPRVPLDPQRRGAVGYWPQLAIAVNSSSPIAGGGSGTATVNLADGSSVSATVFNPFSAAVGASKTMIVGLIRGDWTAISWDC